MKIRVVLYVSPFVDCDIDQTSLCNQVSNGLYEAEAYRSGTGFTEPAFVSLHTVEFDRNGEEEKILGLRKSPTLVFFDSQMNIALSILVGKDILSEKVKKIFLYLAELSPTGFGEYIDVNGDKVRKEDLIDLNGSGWSFDMGLGLGNILGDCPAWMPKLVCNFPFWIFLMLLILPISYLILKK